MHQLQGSAGVQTQGSFLVGFSSHATRLREFQRLPCAESEFFQGYPILNAFFCDSGTLGLPHAVHFGTQLFNLLFMTVPCGPGRGSKFCLWLRWLAVAFKPLNI